MTALTLRTDRTLIRSSARSTRYVLLSLEAPLATERARERAPIDVAFVIDRSGSMSGAKLALARDAVLQGLAMLRQDDRFAIISYDTEVRVDVPLTPATAAARAEAESAVARIEAGSSTNLSGGWLTGCMQLAESQQPRDVLKCLLMSDGQANHGVTASEELSRHARELAARGIVTSTFGIGSDFDEELMGAMARAGRGNAYYIRDARQSGEMLTAELGEALEVVANDAVVHVEWPDGARVEALSDFDLASDGHLGTVHVGTLVSGQSLSIVLKVQFPTGPSGEQVTLRTHVSSREHGAGAPQSLQWTWAPHGANDSQARDRVTDMAVAAIYAARARREALRHNDRGDFAGARHAMQAVASRVAQYSAGVPELAHLVDTLQRDATAFCAPLASDARKEVFFAARSVSSSRTASGKARRGRVHADIVPLTWQNGVPVATIGMTQVAIVTGSPISFGAPLDVLGERVALPASGPIALDELSRQLGARIDTLMGTDLLRLYTCLIDVHAGTVTLGRGDLGLDGISVRTRLANGVPIAEVRVGAHTGMAYLDTGARLSYIDPSLIAALTAAGEETDFYPGLGTFTTTVYRTRVQFAGLEFTGSFGVMPQPLQRALTSAGAQWVIGSELLRQFPLLFDLGHERLQVVEQGLPSAGAL